MSRFFARSIDLARRYGRPVAPVRELSATERGRRLRCPSCNEPKTPLQIACRACWATIPIALRTPVLREFKRAPGSGEHIAAVRACKEFLRQQRAARIAAEVRQS